MSKREDYLSALRTDIVRVLREKTGAPEGIAVKVSAEIIQAMRLRYQGKDVRFGRARVSADQIRQVFDGRNHKHVCRELGISRRTLYRAISQPAKRPDER